MPNEPIRPDDYARPSGASIEMPRATSAPMVLSLGLVVLATGVATSVAFILVGGIVSIVGLGMWIAELLPGRGHSHEPLAPPERRAAPVTKRLGSVEQLRAGVPGYRLRLPVSVRPISAGIRGGFVGGLVMPLPAALYGYLSGRGVWLPLNLLAGTVMPGLGDWDESQLEQFNMTLALVGGTIHLVTSLTLGLIYGVLMPMLPDIKKPLAWGALLMPVLWTAASFALLSAVNPTILERIEWPWFIVSQFIFGVVSALVFMWLERTRPVLAGLAGGVTGGLLMPLPAVAWSYLAGHGIWYPVNLLSAMVLTPDTELPLDQMEAFQANWLTVGIALHVALSVTFGLLYGLLLPRLPEMPGPLAWGALVMPVLWTAGSYGLMGIVNPLLQDRVDWPWFVVSQFVFGLVASIVVVRSEEIAVPPAGTGPDDSLEPWATGGQP